MLNQDDQPGDNWERTTNVVAALEGVVRITRDIAKAARTLTDDEARYAVDYYYTMQKFRIGTVLRVKALERAESDEPHAFLDWLLKQAEIYEASIKRGLEAYAMGQPEHPWLHSVVGIGPVLSAGLAAHIDIRKAPTVGHIWRFAGLDPTQKWEKKTKRPWNANLKVVCWKIGQSFVKVSGRDDAFYGKVYKQRKAYEQAKNDAGDYAGQAAAKLEAFRIGKDTEAYKSYSIGRLPPAHIQQRAERYATKLFLAHYHHVSYTLRLGEAPPKPYVIAHGDHAHYIGPPNFPIAGGEE